MEEGFPGTVTIGVKYIWSDKNGIIMNYKAASDRRTVFYSYLFTF
jgi:galactose mutarotase-like enzyme